jgi:hypothetical protein
MRKNALERGDPGGTTNGVHFDATDDAFLR